MPPKLYNAIQNWNAAHSLIRDQSSLVVSQQHINAECITQAQRLRVSSSTKIHRPCLVRKHRHGMQCVSLLRSAFIARAPCHCFRALCRFIDTDGMHYSRAPVNALPDIIQVLLIICASIWKHLPLHKHITMHNIYYLPELGGGGTIS